MDTTKMEYTAEDLISHKLQKAGILVSKPKFDREGTDLIALLSVKDDASFCRIQCKGRSLVRSSSTPVTIKEEYVKGAFVAFLYVENKDDEMDQTNLFVFFTDDIKKWTVNSKNEYELSITRNKLHEEFEKYRYSKDSIKRIKKIIREAKPKDEIKMLLSPFYLSNADDSAQEIIVDENGTTILRDKRTGTEAVGTSQPSGPGNSEYSPRMDVWTTR